MYDWELKKARQSFAKISGWFASGEVPGNAGLCMEEDGISRFGELLYRKGETEGEYLERFVILKKRNTRLISMRFWRKASGLR